MIQYSMPLSRRVEPGTAMLLLIVVHSTDDEPALYEGCIKTRIAGQVEGHSGESIYLLVGYQN